MKKKWMLILLAIMICVSGLFCEGFETRAEDMGEDIDFSYLLTEDALVGTTEVQTWGVYLAEGNSYISKISSSTIGAAGDTIAATKCQVAVTAIVERKVNGSWVRVTSWNATTTSGYSAVVSKSLSVGTGYYYRVRCSHYAASDVSSSGTDALWMGN